MKNEPANPPQLDTFSYATAPMSGMFLFIFSSIACVFGITGIVLTPFVEEPPWWTWGALVGFLFASFVGEYIIFEIYSYKNRKMVKNQK